MSQAWPVAASTRTFEGFRSLWITDRLCNWPSAVERPMAMRKNCFMFHRALNETMEKLTTGILEHKRFLSVALRKSKGSNCPCCVEIVAKRIFVLYLLEAFQSGAY